MELINKENNNEIKYKKRVAQMLDIYIDRTNLKWDQLKCLILKNATAIENFNIEHVMYSRISEAANSLIEISLLRNLEEESLNSKITLTDEDNYLISLLSSDKYKFKVSENYLDDFIPYMKNHNTSLNENKKKGCNVIIKYSLINTSNVPSYPAYDVHREVSYDVLEETESYTNKKINITKAYS